MLIRDMVRTKPISWLLFIFGSDIMMTYGLLLYHGSTRFNPMRDYITILKFVSIDLVSFVLYLSCFFLIGYMLSFFRMDRKTCWTKYCELVATRWLRTLAGLQ